MPNSIPVNDRDDTEAERADREVGWFLCVGASTLVLSINSIILAGVQIADGHVPHARRQGLLDYCSGHLNEALVEQTNANISEYSAKFPGLALLNVVGVVVDFLHTQRKFLFDHRPSLLNRLNHTATLIFVELLHSGLYLSAIYLANELNDELIKNLYPQGKNYAITYGCEDLAAKTKYARVTIDPRFADTTYIAIVIGLSKIPGACRTAASFFYSPGHYLFGSLHRCCRTNDSNSDSETDSDRYVVEMGPTVLGK